MPVGIRKKKFGEKKGMGGRPSHIHESRGEGGKKASRERVFGLVT